MTEYRPITAVWEITMACNMHCMHCGSACENGLPGELTTEEGLKLCDDIGKLGMKWITLSGGEPLTRKDWPELAKGLKRNNVIANIITNGWLLDKDTVATMKEVGIGTVAISIDGIEKTHDEIRKEGSFARDMKAFKLLKEYGQYCAAITSINKKNIEELHDIKKVLYDLKVDAWQLQICIPMGNMTAKPEELINQNDVDRILDFCIEVAGEKKISIYPADCLGYYTEKEELIRVLSLGNQGMGTWGGCNAGKRGFGILHNGDILGCTSIRDRNFIEGNIRERSIVDIWNDSNSFKWSRQMTRNDLGGACADCIYGDICLGGCPNTRLTMNKTINSENPYCSYLYAMNNLKTKISNFPDQDKLFEKARDYAMNGSYQESALILDHLIKSKPGDIEILALMGFVHFFMGNYQKAKAVNEEILSKEPKHSYANKGLGLTLHRMGKTDEGIGYIMNAIKYAPKNYLDPYQDLAAVYQEIGRFDMAQKTLIEMGKANIG